MLRTALPTAFTHAQAPQPGTLQPRPRTAHRHRRTRTHRPRIYARPNHGADPDLLELTLRNAHTTLCLTTALAHHDLTDAVPRTIDAALPRNHWQPATSAPVTWHRFAPDTFSLGRDELRLTEDVTIAYIAPPERSLTPTGSATAKAPTLPTQRSVAGSANAATTPPRCCISRSPSPAPPQPSRRNRDAPVNPPRSRKTTAGATYLGSPSHSASHLSTRRRTLSVLRARRVPSAPHSDQPR